MRKLIATIFIIMILGLFPAEAKAATVPSFGVCANPTGELKVSYPSGTHSIAGDEGQYSGSDAVYIISSNAYTQCFCAENGDGIQTNWWNVSGLSQDEIEALRKEGWIYIPSGANWGLTDAPFLAQNSTYRCVACTPTPSPSSSSNSGGGSSSGGSSSSTPVGGSIIGGPTELITTLAFTGGLALPKLLMVFGTVCALIGITTVAISKRKNSI